MTCGIHISIVNIIIISNMSVPDFVRVIRIKGNKSCDFEGKFRSWLYKQLGVTTLTVTLSDDYDKPFNIWLRS